MSRILVGGLLAAVTLILEPFGPQAAAQDYPNKSIKLIVPFPAGGPADTIGRAYADKLGTMIGQPVVIENRAGASGLTGISSVAKAEADGYTIGIATSGALAMNMALRDKPPYHSLKDLTLVTQAASVPELLVVSPQVPAKTVAELVAFAKAHPGKLNFASTGLGSMPHMAAELFKHTAKIDIVHLPYTGAAPAVNDMLGGHVQMLFADVPVLLGAVRGGKLRALGIGTGKRIGVLPDVPTMAEAGLPEVEADNWYGIVAPPNLPKAVDDKLKQTSMAALKSGDVTKRLGDLGVATIGNTSAEFTAYVAREIDRWSALAKASGIKLQ